MNDVDGILDLPKLGHWLKSKSIKVDFLEISTQLCAPPHSRIVSTDLKVRTANTLSDNMNSIVLRVTLRSARLRYVLVLHMSEVGRYVDRALCRLQKPIVDVSVHRLVDPQS